jgi:hypothetical protein
VIDSPGFTKNSDLVEVIDFVKRIKEITNNIRLFPIIINGQARSGQKATLNMLSFFEEVFGASFWDNACVIVTHFSNSVE